MYYVSIGIVLKIEYLLYIVQHPTFYKSTSACRSRTSVYVLKSRVTLSCNVVTMLYLPRWNKQLIWPCSYEVRYDNKTSLFKQFTQKSALLLTQFYISSYAWIKNFPIIKEKCKKKWLHWYSCNNANLRSMTIEFVTTQCLCCPIITHTLNKMHLLWP